MDREINKMLETHLTNNVTEHNDDEQTVRHALSLGGQLHANDAARAALDRLVARAETAERERDEALRRSALDERQCDDVTKIASEAVAGETKWRKRAQAAEARVAALEAALAFYAAEKNYNAISLILRRYPEDEHPAVAVDRGATARAALAQPDEEGTA